MENLLQCKGKKFKATTTSKSEGRIQVEKGSIYLCQDVSNRYHLRRQLGFKYSWHIGDGSEVALTKNDVSNLCIRPSTKKRPNLSRIGR